MCDGLSHDALFPLYSLCYLSLGNLLPTSREFLTGSHARAYMSLSKISPSESPVCTRIFSRCELECTGKNHKKIFSPKTCLKFLYHPKSYFHGSVFFFSYNSIVVKLFKIKLLCMTINPKRDAANATLTMNVTNTTDNSVPSAGSTLASAPVDPAA